MSAESKTTITMMLIIIIDADLYNRGSINIVDNFLSSFHLPL